MAQFPLKGKFVLPLLHHSGEGRRIKDWIGVPDARKNRDLYFISVIYICIAI